MISICIPTYNSPQTLQRLLESIFSQTYNEYEIIVSDDSTNEDVMHIVGDYDDGRLKYYHNASPLGTPENWNNAIRNASGEYIKVMHHDDWFVTNDALEKMLEAINNANADFVFCQSAGTPPHTPSQMEVEARMNDRLPYLLSGNIIGAPSATMYRKSSLEYDKNIKYFVDVDFYIEYLRTHRAIYIHEELIQIGTTPVRVTDAVVTDRELVYNEFQYAFLKLWNGEQWNHMILRDVFRSYVEENPDFRLYKIKGLTAVQKNIILRQYCKSTYISFKRKLKRLKR